MCNVIAVWAANRTRTDKKISYHLLPGVQCIQWDSYMIIAYMQVTRRREAWGGGGGLSQMPNTSNTPTPTKIHTVSIWCYSHNFLPPIPLSLPAARQKHNQSMLHCLFVIQPGNEKQQNNSLQMISIITAHIQMEMKRTKEEEKEEEKGDDLCLIKQVPSQTMFKWRGREGRIKRRGRRWWPVLH